MTCNNRLKIVGYLKTEEGNAIKGINVMSNIADIPSYKYTAINLRKGDKDYYG